MELKFIPKTPCILKKIMIKTIGVIGAGSVGSALISKLYKNDPENIYRAVMGEPVGTLVTE